MSGKRPPDRPWTGESVATDFIAAILDRLATPVFVKGRDFRFVLVNNALCELVGRERHAILGKDDYDLFPRHEADFFRQKDIELFTTGLRIAIDEETVTDVTGARHVLSTTKVPLRDAHGTVTHLLGTIHDITRLKQAEEDLLTSKSDLEARVEERSRELQSAQDALVRKERLAVLGQLAGGLAHQIRNPLGAIANAAALLKRSLEGRLDPDSASALAIIDEEVWQANRIITDLLDYARVRRPIPRAVAVRDLIEDTLATQILPTGVTVAIDVDVVGTTVLIDADQTRGALGNLIRNALEAMSGDGMLSLRARRTDAGVLLTVSDTGGGVPTDVRTRLFEPLVTTKPLGLGLGLTTAKALIENQGGTVAFREGARGATFDVLLPPAP